MPDFGIFDVVVAADVVVDFCHQFGCLDIGLRLGDIAESLDAGKGFEELEVLPEQGHPVLVHLIVPGIPGNYRVALYGDVQAWIVPGDPGVGEHQVDGVERLAGEGGSAEYEFVFYEYGVFVP